MSKQISPFAALSGAEKQIRWLEYQSIRLPYVPAEPTDYSSKEVSQQPERDIAKPPREIPERPLPPPEILQAGNDFVKTRHSQYDAVIARMKQAELQSRRYPSQAAQKGQ